MFVYWLVFAVACAAGPSVLARLDGYPTTTYAWAAAVGLGVFLGARLCRGRRAVLGLPIVAACGVVWWRFGHQLLLGHPGLEHLAVTGPAVYIACYAAAGWLSSFTRQPRA